MNDMFWWKWKSIQRHLSVQASYKAMVRSHQRKAAQNFRIRIKNILVIVFIISSLIFPLNGCSSKYGRHDPDKKQALRTLAGGVVGVLIAGNTGGAIVGAFIADVVSVATIKYEDKQLENGDQAAKKYKELEKKAEEKKDQEKKAEEKKDQEQKAEDRKDLEKKAEEKKDQEKKVEDKKEQERKAEEKKNLERKAEKRKFEDKRVKLIIEDSSVASHTVETGATVKADIQYTLLAPEGTDNVRITETRKIWTAYNTVELDSRDIIRTQGTYRSSIQFRMPEDIPRGYCILYTTVSDGRQVKTARSVMNIL
jgi:outer membrane biosynthesis protein TonB